METDKLYWHRYIDEYERLVFSKLPNQFSKRTTLDILEIGVGSTPTTPSIEFLANRFRYQNTNIIGADILEPKSGWYSADNVSYVQLDQSDKAAVENFFAKYSFDLIIDDGSHQPEHQAICLIAGMPALREAGFYIVEDLHTSEDVGGCTPLRVLLAFEHLKRINIENGKLLPILASMSGFFFSCEDLCHLFNAVDDIYFYRRSTLPLHCCSGHCMSSEYNYVTLTCKCGRPLYLSGDSLTAIIRKR